MVASNHVYYEMETWAYDAVTDTWQNRMPSVYPPYRYSHAVGWDGTRTFLFSGNDGTQLICEWYGVEDGSIAWIRALFDTAPFAFLRAEK